MRGDTERQADIMLAVTPGSFVPADHPIRRMKPIVDAALARLSPLFDSTYSTRGGPSIPPEHLLKASLLIALYPVCSERQFCERLRYGLLFKWFLDLNIADEPFDASTFSKKRERLLSKEVAVSPGKATLRYTIPMPQDSPIAGQDSEQLILPGAVLPTVRLGRPTGTVLRTFEFAVALERGPSEEVGGAAECISAPLAGQERHVRQVERVRQGQNRAWQMESMVAPDHWPIGIAQPVPIARPVRSPVPFVQRHQHIAVRS